MQRCAGRNPNLPEGISEQNDLLGVQTAVDYSLNDLMIRFIKDVVATKTITNWLYDIKIYYVSLKCFPQTRLIAALDAK